MNEVLKRIKHFKATKSKKLNLRYLDLTEIPKEIFKLDYTENLQLSFNEIMIIPEKIKKLNCRIIEMHHNPIEIICS